ncbi:MAG: hypothetical protein WC400_00230 [Patescibacteria group bacterium]|jgi:hypothetical protein
MSDFITKLGMGLVELLSRFIGLLAEMIAGIIMPIVNQILDILLGEPNWVFSSDSALAKTLDGAHAAALSLANGFLLLGLLIASIAIILRIGTGTYNIKKFLGSFIIMAILANLSQPIFYALLEVGNALLNSVSYLFSATGIGVTLTDITTYLKDLAGIKITDHFFQFSNGTVLVLVAMVISAWVLIKLALLLIERAINLFVMLIIAPLSFGLSVLPTTQKMASQWFENVFKWLLAMPITYAILALGVFVLEQIESGKPSEFIYELSNSINVPNGSLGDNIKDLFSFIIGMTLIYMGGTVPKMLKLGGSLTGLVESPNKMISLGQKGWKQAADTVTGKNLAGKGIGLTRSATGGLLNLATGSEKFGKFRNIGTQIGAIPATIKKAREALKKTRESESGMAAARGVTRLADLNIAGWNPWRPGLIKGVRGEVHEETAKRHGYAGYDALAKTLLDSSDSYINYATNARVADDVVRNTRLVPKERYNAYRLLRSMQHAIHQQDPKMKDSRSDQQKITDADLYGEFMADKNEKNNQGWLTSRIKRLTTFERDRLVDPTMKAYYLDSRDVEPPADKRGNQYIPTQRDDLDDEAAGGISAPHYASSSRELQLAQAEARSKIARGTLTAALKPFRLDEQAIDTMIESPAIDKLSKSPAAQAELEKIRPEILDALAQHEDGTAIMSDLSEGRAIGKTQLRVDIPAIREEEISALAIISQEAQMSPADIQLSRQLRDRAKAGNMTIGQLIDRIKPALDETRSAQQTAGDLSAQVSAELGSDTTQSYQQAVDLLIQERIEDDPKLTVEAVRDNIHTGANNMYDQLISRVGDIADVTDDMTVDSALDQTTKNNLDKFFQDSGGLGAGMTGTTLNNTRLSQVLQRVRLIRQNTKAELPPQENR